MKDLTNKQFGALKAVRPDGKNKNNQYFWVSQCECGREHRCLGTSLLRGDTVRCKQCTKNWHLSRNQAKSTNVGDLTSAWWGAHVVKRANGYNNSKYLKGKKQTFELDITMEYIWDLFLQQEKKCALSRLPLQFPEGRKVHGGTASLDRIDSTKGYVKGNVQWLHKEVNMLKGPRSDKELVELCKLIAKNNE